MSRKKKHPQRKRQGLFSQHTLRRWHRTSGLIVAAFLLLLTLTGVFINHAHDLKLDTKAVNVNWLLDVYGIKAPEQLHGFSHGGGHLVLADNQVWLNGRLLFEADSTLTTAMGGSFGWLVAENARLHWLSAEGELLDSWDGASGLPAAIGRLGIDPAGRVWLQGEQGNYRADGSLLSWEPASSQDDIEWSKCDSRVETRHIADRARSAHLNWQTVLLDLHSGRLFGAWAVWLWDLFALLLVLMSCSGLWIWLKRKR